MELEKSGAAGDRVKRTLYGVAAVALATVLCFRLHLGVSGAIPVFLLIVVLHSMTGDFPSAALISILSVLSLDYFFTAPLFALRMTDSSEILALLSFAITALVITRLVTRVRAEANSARRQKDRLDRLYQLSQQLLALEPEDAASEKFLDPFRRLFGVTAVCIFDVETADLTIVGDSHSALAEKTREAYVTGRDFNDPNSGIAVRGVRVGGNLIEVIGFEGLRHAEETAGPLTALTAALLARIRAFRKASAASAAAQTEIYRSAVLDALAHEFKTPLATILAAIGGLRESGPLLQEQMEMADTVENEAARLGNLTSRLLRTARLDREDIKPRMEWVDLGRLAARVAEYYAAKSSDRRIQVTAHEPALVFADPELLQLTVGQLIENACKYSQPGSTVSIGTEQKDDSVTLSVTNSGSSIQPHEQRRIFERFYRGTDARRSTSGSGLGLYVARKIAAAHGGALELEPASPEKDGVTFSLKLPSAKEESKHALATE
jgi:two-component system sensor histidine kinase KdpD